MAGTLRSRYRDSRGFASGTLYRRYIGTSTRTVSVGAQSWCTDVVGSKETANPLDQRRVEERCWLLNGKDVDAQGTLISEFKNYPVTYMPGPKSTLGKYPVPSQSELDAIALDLCSRTNPSVPLVSLPAFLGELKDFPGMIRELPLLIRGWGQGLLRMIAQANISWRFGWAPMIGDIRKMLQFQAAVHKRWSMLERLKNEKSIRRRRLYEDTPIPEEKTSSVAIQTNGGYVFADRFVAYNMKKWATVQWKLLDSLTFPIPKGSGFAATWQYAMRLTYGLTCYEALAATWELIPWSWLVDWFIPVGDFIAANNNTLPLRATNLCFMRTLTSKSRYVLKPPPTTSSWISISGRQEEVEVRKQRYVLTPPSITSLIPTLPALTNGQWSILGSLAYLRRGRH